MILARTFSKTFSPGLKTGYGVLPEALVEPVLRLKGNHDFGSAQLHPAGPRAAAGRRRATSGTSRRWSSVYRRKRDVMLAALDEHFAPFEGPCRWTRPAGGLFVWLTVPEGVDTGPDGPLFPRCVARGRALRAGRVRLRRRAGAGAEEPRPALLRRAGRGRAGRRGAAAGGGAGGVPGPRRLTRGRPNESAARPTERSAIGSGRLTWGKDAEGEAGALRESCSAT